MEPAPAAETPAVPAAAAAAAAWEQHEFRVPPPAEAILQRTGLSNSHAYATFTPASWLCCSMDTAHCVALGPLAPPLLTLCDSRFVSHPCCCIPHPQNDISCGIPESQVLALRFLPHLPHDYLCALLDKGEAGGGAIFC
jgi:hypothetical protein